MTGEAVGRAIMLMFGLMIVGGMIYLFVSNEFVTLAFHEQLADQMGLTTHQLGLYLALLVMFVIPVIILPLIVVLVVWTR